MLRAEKRECPQCNCEVTCPRCAGGAVIDRWVYHNVPGTTASARQQTTCSLCQGTGIRSDHICARVEDIISRPEHVGHLRSLIENPANEIPGTRRVQLFSPGGPITLPGQPLMLHFEPTPRRYRATNSPEQLHAWDFRPPAPVPQANLHTSISCRLVFEPRYGDPHEEEVSTSWLAYLDDWLLASGEAVRAGGIVRLVRLFMGTR